MVYKLLTHEELEDIAEHLLDEPGEENKIYFLSSDSEVSKREIEQQTENSATEQKTPQRNLRKKS